MAAILRSSVIQTSRRAFSGEGTLSVRALHTARRRKVDPSFKKNDVARKESVVGYCIKRLKREMYSSKPSLLGNAMQCMLSITAIGAFMLGQQVGSYNSLAENCQASGGKQA